MHHCMPYYGTTVLLTIVSTLTIYYNMVHIFTIVYYLQYTCSIWVNQLHGGWTPGTTATRIGIFCKSLFSKVCNGTLQRTTQPQDTASRRQTDHLQTTSISMSFVHENRLYASYSKGSTCAKVASTSFLYFLTKVG